MHFGLLLVQLVEPKPSPRHMMPRTNEEESIPITAPDGVGSQRLERSYEFAFEPTIPLGVRDDSGEGVWLRAKPSLL